MKILTTKEAMAIEACFNILNTLTPGAKLDVTFGTPDDGIRVYEYKWTQGHGKVYVHKMHMGFVFEDECYDNFDAFSEAYF